MFLWRMCFSSYFYFLLADLPVSQFLLIAIFNGGAQWACVCMGTAIIPQEIFQFVTIKIFKNFTKNVHETYQFQL